MLTSRLVPVLLASRRGLVKTTRFKSPVYIGDPINVVRIFNDKEVDEIVLVDIEASAQGTGPNLGLVSDVAAECFMPLAYGGGIRSVEDAKRVLGLGVEKLVIRTTAARDLSVVREIANYSGSQSVAVAVDLRRGRLGRLGIHCPGTPRHGGRDWQHYLRQVTEAGAGEVILTAVEREGTMAGMDLDIIATAAEVVTTPLMAVGGVGSLADIKAGLDAGASAIGAGAFFVFHGPRRAVLVSYPEPDMVHNL